MRRNSQDNIRALLVDFGNHCLQRLVVLEFLVRDRFYLWSIYFHSSAFLRQAYARPSIRNERKNNTPTRAFIPNSWTMVAHGNRNMASMSNMRKRIAKRQYPALKCIQVEPCVGIPHSQVSPFCLLKVRGEIHLVIIITIATKAMDAITIAKSITRFIQKLFKFFKK